VLSIVIPTYEYSEGVQRILNRLSNQNNIEILIFDDSTSNDVAQVVQSHTRELPIIYKRNKPALGAIDNWNALIKAARGEYVWLLHHDEFPADEHFLDKLIQNIQKNKDSADVYVLPCYLYYPSLHIVRQHIPQVLQRWLIQFSPSYLFKRNIIGPTSTLVVKRELYPHFNNNLKWLVDVDAFYRLTKLISKWCYLSDVKIISMQQRSNSITKNIQAEIKTLKYDECHYLISQYPEAKHWLDITHNKIKHQFEAAFWLVSKVIFSMFSTRIKKL
jgi:glycosyltransferase involved in cell wall biosynthesis